MGKIGGRIKIVGLIVLVVLIYSVFILQIISNQKIAPGVKIANLKVGRHDILTSTKILQEKWDEFAHQQITLTYQEKTWSVKLADLGFKIDYQSSINQAYQITRHSNFLINLKEQLAALAGKYNLEPVYQIDQGRFQGQTDQIFKEIEQPAENATLVFNQEINDFSLKHSTQGTIVNRKKLLTDLTARIKNFSNQPIDLEIITDYPTVENDEVELALEKARLILANRPYQLTLDGKTWSITKNRLIDWLKFKPTKEEDSDNQILGVFLDDEKIGKYLDKITSYINQKPINARLETEGDRAVVFSPGYDGFEVKKEQTIEQLKTNLFSETPIKTTKIIADKSSPKIKLWQTNNLGINTLIGQGISNFAGSPKNRIHNIKTGANKFNGLILRPGQEFSFNTLLDGSGPEDGFLPELVIKKGKTVPEYGGGLCQVSTTMFRAAVNAGLKITERQPHSFPVQYYNPQGFDATVYDPRPDLRFINNTPNHLLIEAIVDGNWLIFNFYGTDDGRKVEIKGPYILEKNKDGSMKTVLCQNVYQNGEKIISDTFFSSYKSPDLYPVETGQGQEETKDEKSE
jgi:vancomycin resistance protein YoaR